MKPAESPLSGIYLGPGKMGALIQRFDWSATPLGPPESWSPSFRSALGLCLNASFPICLYWGAREIMLYNDAYIPIAGNKHPWALGRPGRDVWPEIAPVTQPLLRRVVKDAEAVLLEDQLLALRRHGYIEECYFNYTLTPVRGEDGRVEGILTTVVETTQRVLAERRVGLLRQLGERLASAESVDEVCRKAAALFEDAVSDLPFALIYLVEDEGAGRAQLVSATGIEVPDHARPPVMEFDKAARQRPAWPLRHVLETRCSELVLDLAAHFGCSQSAEPWPEIARSALVAPMAGPMRGGALMGFLITGLSARRNLDSAYRLFVEQAAGTLATAIANIRTHEEERERLVRMARMPDRTAPEASPSRRANILLIEDNLEMRNHLKRILDPYYDVVALADGAAALREIGAAAAMPDLVLTEITMPDASGVEVVKHLREDIRLQTTPVVILSTRMGKEATIQGLEAGADDYLTKPFSAAELLARMRKNLEMARMRREAGDAKLEEHKVTAEAERLALLRRIVNAQEDERLRIARELHDQMGQDLTGLSLGLKSLEPFIKDSAGLSTLRWLESLTRQIDTNVHKTAWELRPTALDDLGLPRALETYLADWSERFGIRIGIHYDGIRDLAVPVKIATTAFRLVQEAFINILRHAAATRVSLMLERHGDLLQIIVEDDGRGFDTESPAAKGRFGLASMRERLALVGGTLTIDSETGVGTTLYFRLPLADPEVEEADQ